MSAPAFPSPASPPPGQWTQQQPAATARIPWWAKLSVAVVIVGAVGGFFHVVHGGSVGCTVVAKESWGLSDTFVDVDDYVGHSWLEIIGNGKAPVARALIRAGILTSPLADREDEAPPVRVPSVEVRSSPPAPSRAQVEKDGPQVDYGSIESGDRALVRATWPRIVALCKAGNASGWAVPIDKVTATSDSYSDYGIRIGVRRYGEWTSLWYDVARDGEAVRPADRDSAAQCGLREKSYPLP